MALPRKTEGQQQKRCCPPQKYYEPWGPKSINFMDFGDLLSICVSTESPRFPRLHHTR